jgi:lipid-A-disaccharide synthase
MSRWVDRLAVVFPFEEAIFERAGVSTRFVGHPLLDDLRPEVDEATLRGELGLGPGTPFLGLLPGSRPQEITRHLGRMLEAARLLRATRPDLAIVVPVAPGLDRASLAAHVPRQAGVHLLTGRVRATQAFASACAVASGTATLETALFGTPLAVVYRTGRVNFAIARRLVHLARIGLPNIVLDGPEGRGEPVTPELVQDDFTPARLAAVLAPWLDDARARSAQRERLAAVRARLGGPGASRRVAELLWSLAA